MLAKLKPEVKEKWVAALRSGAYKQTNGCLRSERRDGTSYCCLGVLCEVLELPKDPSSGGSYAFGWQREHSTIPENWALENICIKNDKANTHESICSVGAFLSECMIKNDQRGFSFKEIADWIENSY